MDKLGKLVAREANIAVEHVMLLRHSSRRVNAIVKGGGTVEDYTVVQPTGSKFDYRHPQKPPIEIAIVIVDNTVHGVYRILGVEKEGTNYSLEANVVTEMNRRKKRREVPARLFKIEAFPSLTIGKRIVGWEKRQRTPVQRSDSRFFNEIEVDTSPQLQSDDDVQLQFEKDVEKSVGDSSAARRGRLAVAPKMPRRIEVRSFVFERNSDVVAEVLARASGRCELCKKQAPFAKKSDGSPYLEVHHKVRLASGGEDTIENAHALCPNCHRREHYG